ncbi:uncharacterized protein BP5553_03966 [Venustampulla echinocandica]|uniref:ribonuclease T2 n=1 Tax=Venustampulla echinocandica TaxID=2656787 RepID=A0A370TVS1_9HELO|nr:uncharacterized protein BP5553_03966 [Venustampulla echinocandica]RDL39626.1 hypothetical protein BP5553_03966 [Venustampulla echinocandica]
MAITKLGVVFSTLIALPVALAGSVKTCSDPPLSCSSSTSSNTCCLNTPGGQLVQTQFWDSNPSTGMSLILSCPSDSWTIHGLWPDHCDGTYDSSCDSKRAYKNITQILQAAGKGDLLSYMDTHWVDINGDNEQFWEHEWAKHGTCISTLDPNCYTSYTPTQEVPDFFQKTIDLFTTLDSYTALKNAGIVPSTSATYTSAKIQSALETAFGHPVTIRCQSKALNEIWYSFYVQGSVQTGNFVPTAPVGTTSNCPSSGVKYPPK